MEKVLGFGGFFFRARDPKGLARWYETHLGIRQTPPDYEHAYWVQERGPTVFEPFEQDTDYFGDMKHSFMLNFRVRDLLAMVKQLQDAGIEVEVDSQVYPNGVFARLRDPEGNPIAIWQPKGDELSLPISSRSQSAA
jgi:predicted enzyme related to lactoylglutathione lyase